MPTPRDLIEARDERINTSPHSGNSLYALSKDYVGHFQERDARIRLLDQLVAGKPPNVFPKDPEWQAKYLLIANTVAGDWKDQGKVVGGVEPTPIVPPRSEEDKPREEAQKIQNILSAIRAKNRLRIRRREWALDLAGTGLSCAVVWPDYSGRDENGKILDEEMAKNAFPLIIRKNPRYCYPDPSFTSPDDISNMIVSRRQKLRVIESKFPGTIAQMFSKRELAAHIKLPDEVELIEFYDANTSIAIVVHKRGEKDLRHAVLVELPNKCKKPLAVLGMSLSPDGQFRGQFDEAIAPMAVANLMMNMHLDSLGDMIYSEPIIKGRFDNPQDVGTGASITTQDPNAEISRRPPAGSHPQMYADLQWLSDNIRESTGVPNARHGDISQSIASAAFVSAVQGRYLTQASDYHIVLADFEERMNSLALAVDEKYLDVPGKPISGVAGGKHFSTTYTPSSAIKGRYENRVMFGDGSGLDKLNQKTLVLNDERAGLISKHTARIKGTDIEDVDAEEREIAREALEQSVLAGLALETTPLETRLQAYDLLQKGKSITEIARELLVQPAPPQEQEVIPTETITAAATRGGVLGESRSTQGFEEALPPLEEVMGA